jgi:NAD(P)-dependent dehydrogenase (short-subunit alcohol dehydrogenase family)
MKNLERYAKLFDLSGRTAIVTGGAQGNGLGIANALSDAGASVAALDLAFSDAKSEDLARNLREGIGRKLANTTDEEQVAAVFAEIEREYGKIDILVNNAGISRGRAEVRELPLEDFRAVLEVNLTGTVICTKHAIPYMKKNGWGRIVNMSSSQAYLHTPAATGYAASKVAVSHLTKIWAEELAPHGIIVNALCPSYIMTPMMEESIRQRAEKLGVDRTEMLKIYTDEVPLHRFLEVDEVANWAVLLCGELAGSTTGHNFAITAGQVKL